MVKGIISRFLFICVYSHPIHLYWAKHSVFIPVLRNIYTDVTKYAYDFIRALQWRQSATLRFHKFSEGLSGNLDSSRLYICPKIFSCAWTCMLIKLLTIHIRLLGRMWWSRYLTDPQNKFWLFGSDDSLHHPTGIIHSSGARNPWMCAHHPKAVSCSCHGLRMCFNEPVHVKRTRRIYQ